MNEPYGFCQVVVGQEHQEIVQGLDVQSIKESMYVMNINPIAYLSRYFEQAVIGYSYYSISIKTMFLLKP